MFRTTLVLMLTSPLLIGCQPESKNTEDNNESQSACIDNSVCKAWLDTHNSLRNQVNTGTITDDGTEGNYPLASPAIGMLEWNETLAKVAQNYADQCQWGHNSQRQSDYVAQGGENIYIGENIAANWFSSPQGSAADYATEQTDMWWREHSDWHYQPFQTGTINGAGHFTQMIWANTVEVGCGIAYCKNFDGSNKDAYYGVCNYGPGGNYSGRTPYPVN